MDRSRRSSPAIGRSWSDVRKDRWISALVACRSSPLVEPRAPGCP